MPRLLVPCLALVAFASLTGCALNPNFDTAPTQAQYLHGVVHGGQQPVVGSVVRLMAPGLNGYGSTPSVLTTTVSDGGGGFTLPAYTCPANNGLVYLQVTGGNSGAGINTYIDEVAVLGPCSTLLPSTFIIVSEATTIAAAYTLAPFATVSATATGIGTSASNTLGLKNAFGAASNLVDFASGNARGAASIAGLILPQTTINSLANALAACVNTSNLTTSTPCNTLFTATTVGNVAPTDTFQAALNIALHPGTQTSNLYTLSTANAPFQPALTTVPSDFALAIAYNGGVIANSSGTNGVAIDATGNAWISTGNFSNIHAITEISPAGVYLSGAAGYGTSSFVSTFGISIANDGTVYVSDPGAGDVVHLAANGAVLNTITASNFQNPNGNALGADGNLYVTNFNGTKLVRILTASQTQDPAGIFTTGQEGVGVAANTSAIWVANFAVSTVSRLAVAGTPLTTYAPGGTPSAMALDANGNAWTTILRSVVKFSDSGTLLSGAGFATNSAHIPQDIVIDGLNRAWVSNYQGNYALPGSLIELDNSGNVLSSNDGFVANGVIPGGPAVPNAIAIDGSGNVWITGYKPTSSGAASVSGNAVAEIIGIAAPIVTPRALATSNNTIATRP